MPNYLAVVISVTLVLVFGEILPSALFTGPDQLLTAAFMTRFVYFLLALFYPIAFPISKCMCRTTLLVLFRSSVESVCLLC